MKDATYGHVNVARDIKDSSTIILARIDKRCNIRNDNRTVHPFLNVCNARPVSVFNSERLEMTERAVVGAMVVDGDNAPTNGVVGEIPGGSGIWRDIKNMYSGDFGAGTTVGIRSDVVGRVIGVIVGAFVVLKLTSVKDIFRLDNVFPFESNA